MKNRRSGFFGFGKRSNRSAKIASMTSAIRKSMFEPLERRDLLAGLWDASIVANTGLFLTAEARAQAAQYINSMGGGLGSSGNFSGGGPEGANDGVIQSVVEVEPNNSRNTAQFIPLGLQSNQFFGINVTGSNPSGDVDWYSFDLQPGDIIDIRLTSGFTPYISLLGATGSALATTTNLFGDTLVPPTGPPDSSPLTGSSSAPAGNVALHYVIPTAGRYFARLSEIFAPYTANFRVYRPGLESQPAGTQQILYLDFDGDIISKSTFGLGPGSFNWGGVSDFVDDFALNPGDADLFIDDIIRITQDKFDNLIGKTTNPNFGLRILNSRDDGDLWGLPNVSRMMVGGTLNPDDFLDDNEELLGIAESVDVGNFATEETAIVMIDRIAPFSFAPIFSSATRREYAATIVAEVIAHEAGHFFGAWHQGLNNVQSLMDYAANPFVALGDDFIWGTPDDGELHFEVDGYSGYDFDEDAVRSGQYVVGGVNNAPNFLGWGLTSGTVGGKVEGVVFQDLNLNRSLDNQDSRLSSIVVFADLNNNGLRDVLEPSVLSAANGAYSLLLSAGTYTIRSEMPSGYRAVAPQSNSHSVTVALNGTVTSRNFGYELINRSSTGQVFNDLNGDRIQNLSEQGLAGTWVYIDSDGDCRLDIGEASVRSSADGSYILPSPGAGTFFIRQVLESGRVQTTPFQDPNLPVFDSCSPVGHRVVLTGNPSTDALVLAGLNFGNQVRIDFGDAPASYGSVSHGFLSGFNMGALWDTDATDQPSPNADGDDLAGIDDEDGVALARPLVRGSTDNRITVTTTNSTGQSAFLNAWIDLDKNGTFDAGERVITDTLMTVIPGQTTNSQLITFSIPATAQLGDTFLRFRYSLERGLGPTGFVNSGEVEDYKFTIVNSFSLAVDDTASVRSNSALNPIDVLANDFSAGSSDPLRVISTTGVTTAGGSVSISADGSRVLYTPAAGFIGTDSFIYTMENSSLERASATVIVDVNLFFDLPVAVDDSFDVATNTVDFPLNVLANDIEGQNGALSIISITQPDKGGQVSIATGGKSLRYTPRRDFGGTEFFMYTATDSAGNRTTARVTLHTLPGARLDDDVEIKLVATDLAGNPISAIEQGRDFKIQVFVDDARLNPGASAGVYSAYFDLLYNMQLATLKPDNTPGSRFNFEVDFLNSYVNFTTGDASIPGVINDFGATSNNSNMQNPDPLVMAEITFTARSAGILSLMPDPSDGADLDTLLFNQPATVVPVERIRYIGVQLEIFGDGVEFPFAVDDIVTSSVPVNSIRFPIDVLANDRRGSTGNVSIVAVSQAANGNVEIQNRGGNPADQILTFTPNINFVGLQQFTYRIRDSRGISSTATVTLRVGNLEPADVVADFDLVITDLSGQPIDEVTVGGQFQVRAFIQDVRGPLGSGPELRGLFNAYMDVLYSSNLVSPVLSTTNDPDLGFVVSFGPSYGQVRDGDVRIPGLINEIGAQANSENPVGPGRFLLFAVTMTANRTGTATFASDPADVSPFHDSLTYVPAQPVLPSETRFGFDTLSIVSASGGGNGEFHNSSMPLDVNNDGYVSAIDALLVINHLNGTGLNSGGEGENPPGRFYPDTSGDDRVSAMDALLVINHLNSRTQGGAGEAEGEAAPQFESSDSVKPISDKVSSADDKASARNSPVTPLLDVSESGARIFGGFAAPADVLFGQSSDVIEELDSLLVDLAMDIDNQLSSGL